jgi:hypothetical protein
MSQPPGARPSARSVLVGVWRIAIGRADGVGCFGGTPQSFLASLAPLVAFPLVGGVMMLAGGEARQGATYLLATLCALLTPAVISYELARLWRREAQWLRFATAFNWCQWALPILAAILVILVEQAMTLGANVNASRVALVLTLMTYGFWLHWFLARQALSLSGGRAALFVLGVNLGTVLAIMLPHLLATER